MENLRPFKNWAGTEVTGPLSWYEPVEVEEVVSIVKECGEQGKRLKMVGSAHSWSGIAKPDEWVMSIGKLDRILLVDALNKRVKVQAGIQLKVLLERLEGLGLSLPVVGSIAEQTVAGAISTGTHGSSLHKRNISGYIRQIKWVDGKGNIQETEEGNPLMDIVRVGLGAIGVIIEVTFEVEEAFLLEEEAYPELWQHAMLGLEELAKSAEFVKWWWLPHTGRVQVFKYAISDGPPDKIKWLDWLDAEVLNQIAFKWLLNLGGKFAGLIPFINQIVSGGYFKSSKKVLPSWKALTLSMPPVHRELEYAVPWQMVIPILERIKKAVTENNLKVNFILEVRLVKADASWMNPAFGRDSAMIGVYMAQSRDLNAYFGICEKIFREIGGRPHWGKEFTMDSEVLKLFPKGVDFAKYCIENDPRGIFRNTFLDALFNEVE